MATDKRLDQVKLVNSAESVLVVNGDQVEKATLAGFANSMGSSVPLQQTSEQVSITGLYARTSDGKMVELTKESVAKVVGGLMTNVGGTFYTASISGSYAMNEPQNIAKEVVEYVVANNESKHITFRVIHNKSGAREVYGYIYPGGSYGVITIRPSDGNIRTYLLNNYEYTERIDNFGYNTLAELSSGVAEQMRLTSIQSQVIVTSSTLYVYKIYSRQKSGTAIGELIVKKIDGTITTEYFSEEVVDGSFSLTKDSGWEKGAIISVIYNVVQ